jgi:C1A family cysteine protease
VAEASLSKGSIMVERGKLDVAAVKSALEKHNTPWEAGENALTRMSSNERANHLGVPLPDEKTQARLEARSVKVRAFVAKQASPKTVGGAMDGAESADAGDAQAAALPSAFNLNDRGGVSYVAGVRNQLNCGSCVAFGSVAVLEGTARYMRGAPSLDVDISEAHLFYGWGATVGVNCNTGWLPLPALTFATSKGVTYESEWPYSSGNSNGGSLPATWEQHRAKASGTADVTNNVQAIKNHLVSYGPVTGCFVVYTDFFSYKSGVYQHVSGQQEGGHCVAIVGFDDAQGAWIIKNSWGTSWGMSGFGLIKYGEAWIDTWSNIGVTGVSLRTWTSGKKVIGAYATGHDRNGWIYVQDNGWLRVGGLSSTAHIAMFADLLTAKEKGAYINAFADDGVVTQTYAY